MLLQRRGTERDHGFNSVQLPISHFSGSLVGFTGIASGAEDFNTYANHDYFVDISFHEFSELIAAACESLERQERDALLLMVKPKLAPLLKLALACSEDGNGPATTVPNPVNFKKGTDWSSPVLADTEIGTYCLRGV